MDVCHVRTLDTMENLKNKAALELCKELLKVHNFYIYYYNNKEDGKKKQDAIR